QTVVAPEHVFTLDRGSHTVTHAPPSQVRPLPHCASVVQDAQVPATQLCPGAQPPSLVQETLGLHMPFWHCWLTAQLASPVHAVTRGMHRPPEHVWVVPQFVSLWHDGAIGTHRLLTMQVWPAGQVVLEQSVPVVHTPVRTVERPARRTDPSGGSIDASSGNVAMRSKARCGT